MASPALSFPTLSFLPCLSAFCPFLSCLSLLCLWVACLSLIYLFLLLFPTLSFRGNHLYFSKSLFSYVKDLKMISDIFKSGNPFQSFARVSSSLYLINPRSEYFLTFQRSKWCCCISSGLYFGHIHYLQFTLFVLCWNIVFTYIKFIT